MTGARVFVAVLFLILGASFVASTGFLAREFQDLDWAGEVVAHSHLFFFFPVFGILALAAFYLPAVVFTDLYWRHLPYGKLRFALGAIVVAALSMIFAKLLDTEPRAIWEVSPSALAADRGEPQNCSASAGACRRAPILMAMADLRREGQSRLGLSKFARSCLVDRMLEAPEEMDKERYCFSAGAKLKGAACCEAQRLFRNEVTRLQSDPASRSLSATYDRVFLPLKVFFILIVVVIAALLAKWRDRLDQYYRELIPPIERGIIIGAFAMLFWPIMDYGYQQTANVLFGRFDGVQLRYSLVIVPWALLLLFYFLRRLGRQGEMIGQIAGVVTAAVAVLRYEDLNDWAVRILGIGTNMWIVGVLVALAIVGFIGLIRPFRGVPGPLGSASAPS
jgi:hypothetical protein